MNEKTEGTPLYERFKLLSLGMVKRSAVYIQAKESSPMDNDTRAFTVLSSCCVQHPLAYVSKPKGCFPSHGHYY